MPEHDRPRPEPSPEPRDVVQQFKLAWQEALQGGDPPDLEQFLGQLSERSQTPSEDLLAELVQLDIRYRRARGESVSLAQYAQRFPAVMHVLSTLNVDPDGVLSETPVRAVDGTGLHIPDEDLPVGTLVAGRYRIGELVGKGGMGVVYQAWDEQLQRVVAIKTIRSELSHRTDLRERFRREAKICAVLQHPGVPAVHELGTFEDGRPFLAMKLVQGRTLRKIFNELSNGDEQRWRLVDVLQRVSQTVAFAHASGVVHRDLKPSNIMVGAHGEVQVMDWGLAKSVRADGASPPSDSLLAQTESDYPADPSSTDRELHAEQATRDGVRTVPGAVVGTPTYAAPEQVRGELDRIGPASDVYSLGAILHEILTGAPPCRPTPPGDRQASREGQHPDEPFGALEKCGAEPELIELCRWCLAAEPEARPADAGVLSKRLEEIRNSAAERARRAELERERAAVREQEARRRRRIVEIAAVAIVATLLVGLAGTTVGFVKARQQQSRAEQASQRERVARLRAEENERRARAAAEAEKKARLAAERNLQFARQAYGILSSMLRRIAPASKYQSVADLRKALVESARQAVRELEGLTEASPRDAAALQYELGTLLRALGEADEALVLLQRAYDWQQKALGPRHEETLKSLNALAITYTDRGEYDKAEELLKRLVRLRTETLGPDHPDRLVSLTNLASLYITQQKYHEAKAALEEVVQRAEAAGDQRLGPMTSLASVLFELGEVERAIKLQERVVTLAKKAVGSEHPFVAGALNNLAALYAKSGQPQRALPLYEEAYTIVSDKLGPDHPNTLRIMGNIANVYGMVGDYEKSLQWLRRAHELHQQRFGPDHVRTLQAGMGLARALARHGQHEQAVRLLEEIVPKLRARFGPVHSDYTYACSVLARSYYMLGRRDDAIRVVEEVIGTTKAAEGPLSLAMLGDLNSVGVLLIEMGEPKRAIRALEVVYRQRNEQLGPEHPLTVEALGNLAMARWRAGQLKEAIADLEKALTLGSKVFGKDHDTVVIYKEHLARVYADAGENDRAIAVGEEVLRRIRETEGNGSPRVAFNCYNLALAYLGAGQRERALSLLKEAADILAPNPPRQRWAIEALNLALRLHEQAGLYAVAERWRRHWIAGQETRPDVPPLNLAANYDSLVLNLLHQGKYDEARSVAEKSVALREKHAPEDWLTYHARALLGRCLAGLALEETDEQVRAQLLGEAERVLTAAVKGMQSKADQTPQVAGSRRFEDAVRALIAVLEAQGRADAATPWRKLLSENKRQ